ncbi:hypothetical protein T281_10360 [Rhodomicrobium udaipurense JA643]|uniref:hypothetical protein n=1 Tax=Rhodomicrobium udaipurense TaxID=1202716 RepID=UPI00045B426E|nr:hypothetical protein [Rhodomicrobium udaipurense]KAI94550.1 hypothetical protein T281_10360 [Rhodomicrobium udaipurense JA643]
MRAITVRLTAPEGGFFIEGQSPNDKGPFSLVVSLSARDIDVNGVASDLHIPDQLVKVQVRGNFWRGFGSFLRTALLLAAGGGLGAAAYYGLKLMGKVP